MIKKTKKGIFETEIQGSDAESLCEDEYCCECHFVGRGIDYDDRHGVRTCCKAYGSELEPVDGGDGNNAYNFKRCDECLKDYPVKEEV